MNLTEQVSSRTEHLDTVAAGSPHVSIDIGPETVGNIRFYIDEHPWVFERVESIAHNIECHQTMRAEFAVGTTGVPDVQHRLVWRKCDAVWRVEIVADHGDIKGVGIDPVHPVTVLLGLVAVTHRKL